MAASLRDHVYVLAAPVTAVTSETVLVKHIRWVNPTSPGDIARLVNGDGEVIWEAVAQIGTNETQDSKIPIRFVKGLAVDLLDAGTLYVYGTLYC